MRIREGGREGEHDGPRDTGSATAGCYVSAPPALSPLIQSRVCFSPIPHPTAAAHFFFPSTHMAPHMAASSLPPSLACSLSSTHLHPRGATNLYCLCCHSVSLSLLLFCLSASPSLIIFINRLSLSLSLLCSEAAAPRSGLQGYGRERP